MTNYTGYTITELVQAADALQLVITNPAAPQPAKDAAQVEYNEIDVEARARNANPATRRQISGDVTFGNEPQFVKNMRTAGIPITPENVETAAAEHRLRLRGDTN